MNGKILNRKGIKMFQKKQKLFGMLAAASFQLLIFHPSMQAAGPVKNDHAKMEAVGTSGLNRITLTPKAAERLDIKTAKVVEEKANGKRDRQTNTTNNNNSNNNQKNSKARKIVPYAAVLYDVDGIAWAYTSPKEHVFIRHRIEIDSIEGDKAILREGPPVGTDVVTIGVAELYGVEKGIGK
jgi:hypothetical protein